MHVALFLAFIFICLAFAISILLWFKNQHIENSKKAELLALARQVSHDLRSPLSALNHISAEALGLMAEERLILRNAANRINDIANSLAKRIPGEGTPSGDRALLMLSAVLDSIVSDVRIRLRDRMQIEVQANLEESYGLFSEADETQIKSEILQFTNTAIASMNASAGKILVSAQSDGQENRIVISAARGKEVISSSTWRFAKAQPPDWFLSDLKVAPGSFFVSVDDDQTIHQIWARRLAAEVKAEAGIRHFAFSSLREFENWYRELKKSFSDSGFAKRPPLLFMMDQEFTGQELTGLDLIERLGIASMSVLVTSRVEDADVQARSAGLSVKMLPKLFAAWLPLKMEIPAEQMQTVVIDDDPLVHMTWKMTAAAKGRQVHCFSDFESFKLTQQIFSRDLPIYIDVTLADGVRGEDVAEKIFAMGFLNINLATGHDPAEIQAPPCVARIVGKIPTFN